MGTGSVGMFALIVLSALFICGTVGFLTGLIYTHCADGDFEPKFLWLAIGCAAFAAFTICGIVDFSKYDDMHNLKSPAAVESPFVETKTFKVTDLITNEVYENLTDGKFVGTSASFKLDDNTELYFTGPIRIEETTNITRK